MPWRKRESRSRRRTARHITITLWMNVSRPVSSFAGRTVKSIRAGTLNLKDSYCVVKNGEAMVYSMHISPYDKGNIFNHDPDRPKRLLLHKREINKLHALVKQDGYALIPLSVYFKDARVKVELGVCKGKKNYDKREASAQARRKARDRPPHEKLPIKEKTICPIPL